MNHHLDCPVMMIMKNL